MTPRSRDLVVVPAALALVVGLLTAREARAESAPPAQLCHVGLLPTGAGVPANLPAMVVDDSKNSAGLTSTVEIEELVGGASSVKLGKLPDPRTPDVVLLVPPTNDPLASGVDYSLRYAITCSNGTGPSSGTVTFTTGPAVALPTRIGAVKELADGRASITPSSELSAFLQTTRFEAFVDGTSIGMTRYGAVSAYEGEIGVRASELGLTFGVGQLLGSTPVAEAYAGGARPLCRANTGKEKHEAKVVAHVAGTDTDTDPVTFAVEIDCSASRTGTGNPSIPDAGADDRGASGGSDDGGGCSVSARDPLGSLLAVFTTGAALAVLFRRRRAR